MNKTRTSLKRREDSCVAAKKNDELSENED